MSDKELLQEAMTLLQKCRHKFSYLLAAEIDSTSERLSVAKLMKEIDNISHKETNEWKIKEEMN